MNKQIKLPQIQKIMMEFEKQVKIFLNIGSDSMVQVAQFVCCSSHYHVTTVSAKSFPRPVTNYLWFLQCYCKQMRIFDSPWVGHVYTVYNHIIISTERALGHQAIAVANFHIVRAWVQVLNSHLDRKSTRLNSSHANISYAVFCLKKKRISLLNS